MKKQFVKSLAGLCTGIALLAAVPAGAAPAKENKDKNHQDAFMPGNPADNEIAREVRHQLVQLPYYGVFDDLAFNVNGGTVTLLGAVTQPVLKDDAEKTVKRVKGVTQVVNQIEVLPLSPMDDQIRVAVYRAIYGQPGIDTRYGFRAVPSIHILVKNGHVTLEGVVANKGDKDLINITANGVPNVFSVTNDLQVENEEK
jgi:hyperosmotically inducible protein